MVWYLPEFLCNATCVPRCNQYAGFTWTNSSGTWCQCGLYNINADSADGGCSKTISSQSSAEFYLFQIVFGLIFPVIAMCAIFVALKFKRPSVFHTMMFLFMIYTCLNRTVWIWLDPFLTRGILPNWLENAIYGNGAWSLLGVYMAMLGQWMSVYSMVSNRDHAERRDAHLRSTIFGICAAMGSFLLIGTTCDILRAWDFHLEPEANATKSTVLLAFYNIALALYVCIPAVGYFFLGRRLYKRLRERDMLNGIQIEDVHVRRISLTTTTSIGIAISLFVVVFVAILYLSTFSNKPTNNPAFIGAFGLGIHIIYRLGECVYISLLLAFSYFKLHHQSSGDQYIKMTDYLASGKDRSWVAVPTTDD